MMLFGGRFRTQLPTAPLELLHLILKTLIQRFGFFPRPFVIARRIHEEVNVRHELDDL